MNSRPNNLQAAVQTTGFQTSLDLARTRTYSTSSLAGVKRSHSENNVISGFTTASQVLKTASQSPAHNPSRAHATVISQVAGKRRIIASQIRTVSDKVAENHDFTSEYSQRKALSSTPGPTQDPLLSLRHPDYGLPSSLVDNFASLGVNSIYPWQATCLLGKGHLTGEKNLVYSAPTGGGKSLVADVMMLRRVIGSPRKKAIVVLPYVALVQEKLQWLRRLVDGVSVSGAEHHQTRETASTQSQIPNQDQPSIRVTGFFGGSKCRATWGDTDIAVCTIEKVGIPFLRGSHFG
jgi:DNA polymerase theta